MSKKEENKNKTNKAIDYPVIYSYIYEREREDINRLAGKFKNTRKTKSKTTSNRVIIGFKVENGKAVPIYSDKSLGFTEKVAKKQTSKVMVVKSGVVTGKATKTPKKNTARSKQNKNNQGKEN